MNDTIKKYKKHAITGTGLSVLTVIVLFFWDLGVSRSDLKKIPETNKHTETMYAERIKVAANLQQVTKSLDSVIIVLSFTNLLLAELRDKE